MIDETPIPNGLYVITASGMAQGRTHLDIARAAIEGGATTLQLRAPEASYEERLELASSMVELCRQAKVLSIINNDIPIALESGADGVHLGQQDDPTSARAALGNNKVLGISVNSLEEARLALDFGASYLGATVFSSSTKPEAKPLGLTRIAELVREVPLPVVALGGINNTNIDEVLACGVWTVAVISAVAAADDPVRATARLVDALKRYRSSNQVELDEGRDR
ncbi:MAG: thiamine phosphate synthase [Actinobacteria bacterium]|jgi:thiamine-phosphate pyrophosphorylase|nr:thiamine phosphate synthase [Actinomycetota bacterium]MCL6095879.1 thiamine phosphate synthase [Actinomycetota bacterium]